MSREEWLSEKSSALLKEDERINTLNDIKEFISTLPQNEAAETAQSLEMPLLFDCLNDSNTEQVDLACEVLTLCLNTLTLGESTNRYNVLLERALNHPHPTVKMMALKNIQRNITSDQLLANFCKQNTLLNTVVKCIGNDDLGVAKLAADIITAIGSSDNCIKVLLSQEVRKHFEEMSSNEVIRLRIFEVFIKIAMVSKTSHNILESSGLLNEILGDLKNNDILLRMNIIELFSRFVTSEQGYAFLEKNGVMTKLCKDLKDSDDMLFKELCEPGILKFFGQLAYSRPYEITNKYVFVLNRICSNIESDNFTLLAVSVDTLGYIAETDEGKVALNSAGDTTTRLLPLIIEKLNKLPNEVKIRALNFFENMLQVTSNDTRITNITKNWYNSMAQNPMDFIMRYAKNPFSEIRSAGLGILHALSTQSWGQEVIRNTPGLVEFLLDRSVETIKECKELKFEIIKKLSSSMVFNNDVILKLQDYVKEGPFYVQGVTEVAIEGNE